MNSASFQEHVCQLAGDEECRFGVTQFMAALSLSVQEAVNSGLPLCRPDLEREEGDGASVAEEGAHSPATEQVLVPVPDIQLVGFLNQHRYLSN